MTPNKAIEIVDSLTPNTYSEEDKLRWINELDGMVKRLVFQWDEKYLRELKAKYESGELTEAQCKELFDKTKPYVYPDDMDKELLIPAPFENVYPFYLEAQIYYHNKEYDYYNNAVTRFEEQYSEYKKAYIRDNPVRR